MTDEVEREQEPDPSQGRNTLIGEVISAWITLNKWLILASILLLALIAWATLPSNLEKYALQRQAWHEYCQFEADTLRQSIADCLRLHRLEKQVP